MEEKVRFSQNSSKGMESLIIHLCRFSIKPFQALKHSYVLRKTILRDPPGFHVLSIRNADFSCPSRNTGLAIAKLLKIACITNSNTSHLCSQNCITYTLFKF